MLGLTTDRTITMSIDWDDKQNVLKVINDAKELIYAMDLKAGRVHFKSENLAQKIKPKSLCKGHTLVLPGLGNHPRNVKRVKSIISS